MAKVEEPILQRGPLLYCRHVEDCYIVCPTQAELDACFDLLSHQSPHIKFTREKPVNNWLPFLNVEVHLSKGQYRTKWYRKPSNKNILVHYLSAHPSKTKKAVIGNMFRAAKNVSSGTEERLTSLRLAQQVALSNGYPPKAPYHHGRYAQRREYTTTGDDKYLSASPIFRRK